MYVTAHRVRTPYGEEGINVFRYSHGGAQWQAPPRPDTDPGALVQLVKGVSAVGGNVVRSFLDIVAPDAWFWPEIEPRLVKFLEASRQQPLPWEGVVESCRFRLGMEAQLAAHWQRELRELYAACVSAYPARALSRY